MNIYAYCANNPVNWIDPWGLCEQGREKGERPFWKEILDAVEFNVGLKMGLKLNFITPFGDFEIGGEMGDTYFNLENSELNSFHGKSIGVTYTKGPHKLGFGYENKVPVKDGVYEFENTKSSTVKGYKYGDSLATNWSDVKLGAEVTLGFIEVGGKLNWSEYLDVAWEQAKIMSENPSFMGRPW